MLTRGAATAALFCGLRPGVQRPCPAGVAPGTRLAFGTVISSIPLPDGTELRLGADLPSAIEAEVEAGRRTLPMACEFPIAVVQRTWTAADSVTTASVLRTAALAAAEGAGDAAPRCLVSADGARQSRAWATGRLYLTVLREPATADTGAPALMVFLGDEDGWWRRPVPSSLGDLTPVPCPPLP
jgi:hypothetical protein